MNIIGLGRAGNEIAKNFENYEQYKVFYIDTEDKGYDLGLLGDPDRGTFLKVKEQDSHEEYEKNYKKLNLSNCKGPCTFITCGAGKISGIALRVLQQINKNLINIIYIKPDDTQLANDVLLRERATLGILQEYTRSGLFNKMYIVSNSKVEQVLDNLSLKNYWQDINNVISSTYHMLNVFENTEPLLTTLVPENETARIGTFGVVNFDTNNEKLFYDLQHPRTIKYFYGVKQELMGNNRDLLHNIRKFVEERTDENTHAGFSIYNTEYKNNYVYSIHYASYIQEQNIK